MRDFIWNDGSTAMLEKLLVQQPEIIKAFAISRPKLFQTTLTDIRATDITMSFENAFRDIASTQQHRYCRCSYRTLHRSCPRCY